MEEYKLTTTKSSKEPSKTSVRKTKPTKKEIEKVIEKTKSKAEEYARDPNKAKKLLDDAVKKTKNYEKNRGPLAEVWGYLTALFRLLRAYIRKDYRDIPWVSIVLVIVAIIYFVSPIDLIPDVIPVIGLVDDAAVIAFVVAQIKADLDNFLAWEVENSNDEDSAEGN
jgi:uncharacterized membrane protein YkvA (DUF1232 family)